MDRATLNLLIRLTGSTAFAALLLYGGIALERAALGAAAVAGLVFLAVVLTVAANWAMARLNAKRPAQWATLVVLGVLPVLTFLGQWATGNLDGLLGGILWLNLVAGAATILLAAWMLRTRGA